MADILSLLGQLEEEEAKQKAQIAVGEQKGKASKKGRPKDITTHNTNKNTGRRRNPPARTAANNNNIPTSQSPTPKSANIDIVSPSQSSPEPSPDPDSRPSSRGRRISFANTPRPNGNKIIIPTRTDSLASGFPYDPRLNKYRVSEEEWADFNNELIAASDIPGPIFLWAFRKKDVIPRIRKDLQYGGDLQRALKKWNKLFKRQRFQAFLELPGEGSEGEGSGKKRFRIVLTPNGESRAPSVYSRNSSMTRSVSGEGRKAMMDDECAVE